MQFSAGKLGALRQPIRDKTFWSIQVDFFFVNLYNSKQWSYTPETDLETMLKTAFLNWWARDATHSQIQKQGLPLWAEPRTAPHQTRASSSCSKSELLLPELSCEWCWVQLWETRLKTRKNCSATAAGRDEWDVWHEQPCRYQGKCRRRVGDVLGVEQKFQ